MRGLSLPLSVIIKYQIKTACFIPASVYDDVVSEHGFYDVEMRKCSSAVYSPREEDQGATFRRRKKPGEELIGVTSVTFIAGSWTVWIVCFDARCLRKLDYFHLSTSCNGCATTLVDTLETIFLPLLSHRWKQVCFAEINVPAHRLTFAYYSVNTVTRA